MADIFDHYGVKQDDDVDILAHYGVDESEEEEGVALSDYRRILAGAGSRMLASLMDQPRVAYSEMQSRAGVPEADIQARITQADEIYEGLSGDDPERKAWATREAFSSPDIIRQLPSLFASKGLESFAESQEEKLSPRMQEAREKRFLGDDDGEFALGEAWTDPHAYASLITEAIPYTLPSMGAAAITGRATYAREIGRNLMRGMAPRAARKQALKTAGVEAATVGGVVEGSLVGAMAQTEIEDEIIEMSEELLSEAPLYSKYRMEGMTHEEAARALARIPSMRNALAAGVVSGVLGGPVNRYLGRLFGEGRKKGMSRLGAAARVGGAEAVTESIQEGQETILQNLAAGEFDPSIMWYRGVPNAMIAGGIAGYAIGGGLGAIAPGNDRVKATTSKAMALEEARAAREEAEAAARDESPLMDPWDAQRWPEGEPVREKLREAARAEWSAFRDLQAAIVDDLNPLIAQTYKDLEGAPEDDPRMKTMDRLVQEWEQASQGVTVADQALEALSRPLAEPSVKPQERTEAEAAPTQPQGPTAEPAPAAAPAGVTTGPLEEAEAEELRILRAVADQQPVSEAEFKPLVEKGLARIYGDSVALLPAGRRRRSELAARPMPESERPAAAREGMPTRKKGPQSVEDMDVLSALAVMGGLNREEAEAQGIDPADFNRRGPRGRPIFPKEGGMSFDDAAEALGEIGFDVLSKGETESMRAGTADANLALQLVDMGLRGERVRSMWASEDVATEEARADEIADRRERNEQRVKRMREVGRMERASDFDRHLLELYEEYVNTNEWVEQRLHDEEFYAGADEELDQETRSLADLIEIVQAINPDEVEAALEKPSDRAVEDYLLDVIRRNADEAIEREQAIAVEEIEDQEGRRAPSQEELNEIAPDLIDVTQNNEGVFEARIGGRVVGRAAYFSRRGDQAPFVYKVGVFEPYRRRGVASALYRAMEKDAGENLVPAQDEWGATSDDAFEFWNRYRPEAVAEDLRHQRDDLIGSKVRSPRSKRTGTIIDVAARGVTARYDDDPGTVFSLPRQTLIEQGVAKSPAVFQETMARRQREAQTVDEAAAQAATDPTNELREPTIGQIEAGNYRKGHIRLAGLDISIENPRGSKRRPEWPPLAHHYGYIRGTKGKDKDHIDIFLGPEADTATDLSRVWIIDQQNRGGGFDEHKVMLGFPDQDAAIEGYKANYEKGWTVGPVTELRLSELKNWLEDGATTTPASEQKLNERDRDFEYDERITIGGQRATPEQRAGYAIEAPKENEVWYHGRTHEGGTEFAKNRPAFFTRDEDAAAFFTHGEGAVRGYKVDAKNPARMRDLQDIVIDMGFSPDTSYDGMDPRLSELISESSQYEGGNFTDIVYVPKIRREIEKRGFDSVLVLDQFDRHEIPALIVWKPEQITADTAIDAEAVFPDGPFFRGTSRSVGGMSWWTTDRGVAKEYASLDERGRVEQREALGLTKPATSDDIRSVLRELGEEVPRNVDYYHLSREQYHRADEVIAALRARGHDGVYLRKGEDFSPSGSAIESVLVFGGVPPAVITDDALEYRVGEFNNLADNEDEWAYHATIRDVGGPNTGLGMIARGGLQSGPLINEFAGDNYEDEVEVDEGRQVVWFSPEFSDFYDRDDRVQLRVRRADLVRYGDPTDPGRAGEGILIESDEPFAVPPQMIEARNESGEWVPLLDLARSAPAGEVTSLPAFRRWFGDSKVVDESGNPLVVYHGTVADFDVFRPSEGLLGTGIYFTKTPSEASIYAGEEEGDADGRVIPAYLQLMNPISEEEAETLEAELGPHGATEEIKRRGHDGIMGADTIVVFEPTQVKSAIGNRGTFDQTDANILRETSLDLPDGGRTWYFSTLERAVEASKQQSASPQQWLAMLRNTPKVTEEEIEWTGLEEWLGDRDSVPKYEVLEFLRNNGVQVTETVVGEGGSGVENEMEAIRDEFRQYGLDIDTDMGGDVEITVRPTEPDVLALDEDGHTRAIFEEDELIQYLSAHRDLRRNRMSPDQIENVASNLWERANEYAEMHSDGTTGGVYEGYMLPGGEKPRTLLLKLPDDGALAAAEDAEREAEGALRIAYYDAVENQRGLHGLHDASFTPLAAIRGDTDAVAKVREVLGDRAEPLLAAVRKARPVASAARQRQFSSPHFQEPNILAHVRFNERTDADGKRVLFMEEVQSDWHQAGRKRGYGRKVTNDEVAREVYGQPYADLDEVTRSAVESEVEGRNEGTGGAAPTTSGVVPDAPFKKTWPTLVMKRMIEYASRRGFDRIGWTTGDQQVERYKLDRQIDALMYVRNDDGTFDIESSKEQHISRVASDVSESGLPNLVGEDIAKRMLAGDGDPVGGDARVGTRRLAGDNLRIGGSGMREFYDKMLPRIANKIGKKYGATTSTVTIQRAALKETHQPGIQEWEDASVHALDITPELREAAAGGVSLFGSTLQESPIEFDDRERLVVMHNMYPEQLVSSDQLGGLAVPSLAIVKEGMGVRGMGTVTLIGRQHLGDPTQVPIFDADAYTTTFPPAVYAKVKQKDKDALMEEFYAEASEFDEIGLLTSAIQQYVEDRPDPDAVASNLSRMNAVKAKYLRSVGIDVSPIMMDAHMRVPMVETAAFQKFLEKNPWPGPISYEGDYHRKLTTAVKKAIDEYVKTTVTGDDADAKKMRRYLKKSYMGMFFSDDDKSRKFINFNAQIPIKQSIRNTGRRVIDNSETRDHIDRLMDGRQGEFLSWIGEIVNPMFSEPMIQLGRKRVPYTLENIVEAMTRKGGQAQQETLVFGEGNARAAAAKQFDDLNTMKNYAQTEIGTPEDVEVAREETKKLLEDFRMKVSEFYDGENWRGEVDIWNAFDDSMRALAKWAKTGRRDAGSLRSALRRYNYRGRVPDSVIELGLEAGKALIYAPVPYYEAKPLRAVSFDEFAGAVIPEDASEEARAVLDRHNIPYRTYDATGEAREENQAFAAAAFAKELFEGGENVLFEPPLEFPISDDMSEGDLLNALSDTVEELSEIERQIAELRAARKDFSDLVDVRDSLRFNSKAIREALDKRWRAENRPISFMQEAYTDQELRPDVTAREIRGGFEGVSQLELEFDEVRKNLTSIGRYSLMANRIPRSFVQEGANQLIGQTVRNTADLASIAQIYRNPHFETFRVYAMKDGKIVGETAISSRLPGIVAFKSGRGDGRLEIMDTIMNMIRETDADSWMLLHNHPNGHPKPSSADQRMTVRLKVSVMMDAAREDRRVKFLGHVVVDQDSYGILNPDDPFKTDVLPLPPGIDTKYRLGDDVAVPHELLGREIRTGDAIEEVAEALKHAKGYSPDDVIIIGVNQDPVLADGRPTISGLLPIPRTDFEQMATDNPKKLKALILRFNRNTNSAMRFVVGLKSESMASPPPYLKNLVREKMFNDYIFEGGLRIGTLPVVGAQLVSRDTGADLGYRRDADEVREEQISLDEIPPATVGFVMNAIQDVMAALPNSPRVSIVQTVSELPQEVRRSVRAFGKDSEDHTTGVFAPSPFGDRAFLVAENIPTERMAIETVLHEVVGHYGLRSVLGENYAPWMDKIAEAFPAEIEAAAKRNDLDLSRLSQRRIAAEEFIAYAAQRILADSSVEAPVRNWVQRIVDAIRAWMVEHGFAGKLKANEEDIRALIARAVNFVKSGDAKRYSSPQAEMARAGIAPLYYSQMAKVISEQFPERASPDEYAELLLTKAGVDREFAQKKGASPAYKADELKWSGIVEWLENLTNSTLIAVGGRASMSPDVIKRIMSRKKGETESVLAERPTKIPRIALLRFIDMNNPQVVVRGDKLTRYEQIRDIVPNTMRFGAGVRRQIAPDFRAMYDAEFRRVTDAEIDARLDRDSEYKRKRDALEVAGDREALDQFVEHERERTRGEIANHTTASLITRAEQGMTQYEDLTDGIAHYRVISHPYRGEKRDDFRVVAIDLVANEEIYDNKTSRSEARPSLTRAVSAAIEKDWYEKYGEGVPTRSWESLSRGQNYGERIFVWNNAPHDYETNHWRAPNVLVHARYYDVTDQSEFSSEENPAFVIGEIQSDWHQERRDTMAVLDESDGGRALLQARIDAAPKLARDYVSAIVEFLKEQGLDTSDGWFEKAGGRSVISGDQYRIALRSMGVREGVLASLERAPPVETILSELHKIAEGAHDQAGDPSFWNAAWRLKYISAAHSFIGDHIGKIDGDSKRYNALKNAVRAAGDGVDIQESFDRVRQAVERIDETRERVPDAPFGNTYDLLAFKYLVREAVSRGRDLMVIESPEFLIGQGFAPHRIAGELEYEITYSRQTGKPAAVDYKFGDFESLTPLYDEDESIIREGDADEVTVEALAPKLGIAAAIEIVEASKKGIREGKLTDDDVGSIYAPANEDAARTMAGLRKAYLFRYPRAFNRFLKKYGAKFELMMSNPNLDDNEQVYGEQGYMVAEITPALRDAAMEGFPLFAKGPNDVGDPVLDRAIEKIGSSAVLLRDRWEAFKDNLSARVHVGLVDHFFGLWKAESELRPDLGKDQTAYVSARLTTSVASILRAMLEYGHPVWDSKDPKTRAPSSAGDKGLLEILAPLKNDAKLLELWEVYMVGVRAKRLKTEGREQLFENDEIAHMVRLGEQYPLFKEIAKEYAAFKKKVLDFAQDAGVIDAETRPFWDHDDYVPFYRVLEQEVKGPFAGLGLSNTPRIIRKLQGSKKNIGRPLDNIIQNFTVLVQAAINNNAASLAVDNLLGTGLVTKAPQIGFRQALVPMSEVKKILKRHGIDTALLPKDAAEGFQKMMSAVAPQGDNMIFILRNGKREYYQIHDTLLFRAMTAIGKNPWGSFMEFFRIPKRVFTTAITLDPGFVFRNWFRDMWHSFTVARTRIIPGAASVTGAIKALRKSPTMRDMMAGGGSFESGYVNAHDPSATGRRTRARLRQAGLRQSIISSPMRLYEAYRDITSAAENAVRVSIYEKTLAEKGSRKLALYEAKDIMDFSMRGDWAIVQFLAESVPFWNARLQGLYRMKRALAGGEKVNPWAVLGRGALITLFGVGLMLRYWEDERYQELDDWDKDTYWHFWVGDQHFRLPKPFEIGVIFSSIPERVIGTALSEEPDRGKHLASRLAWLFGESLNLAPTVQTLTPFYELSINKNMFLDRPILSSYDSRMLPEAQVDPYTSPTSEWLAKRFRGWGPEFLQSPKQMDHLLRGYLATMGEYAMMASDVVVRRLENYPAPPARRLDEMPIIRSFMREDPARSTKYLTTMYNIMEEADKIYMTINRYEREGRFGDVERLEQEYAAELEAREAMGPEREEISKLNREIRETIVDPDMTPEEKRKLIDELILEKNERAKDVYDWRPGGKANEEIMKLIREAESKPLGQAADRMRGAGMEATADLIDALPTRPRTVAARAMSEFLESRGGVV